MMNYSKLSPRDLTLDSSRLLACREFLGQDLAQRILNSHPNDLALSYAASLSRESTPSKSSQGIPIEWIEWFNWAAGPLESTEEPKWLSLVRYHNTGLTSTNGVSSTDDNPTEAPELKAQIPDTLKSLIDGIKALTLDRSPLPFDIKYHQDLTVGVLSVQP